MEAPGVQRLSELRRLWTAVWVEHQSGRGAALTRPCKQPTRSASQAGFVHPTPRTRQMEAPGVQPLFGTSACGPLPLSLAPGRGATAQVADGSCVPTLEQATRSDTLPGLIFADRKLTSNLFWRIDLADRIDRWLTKLTSNLFWRIDLADRIDQRIDQANL